MSQMAGTNMTQLPVFLHRRIIERHDIQLDPHEHVIAANWQTTRIGERIVSDPQGRYTLVSDHREDDTLLETMLPVIIMKGTEEETEFLGRKLGKVQCCLLFYVRSSSDRS